MIDRRYHALYNNSHHFVTWAKTGKENPLTEITKDTHCEGKTTLDPVLTKRRVTSLQDLHCGDHLMIVTAKSSVSPIYDQHCLIQDTDLNKGTYTAYYFKGCTVCREEHYFKADDNAFCIEYDGDACVYPAEEAIKNAEKFRPKWDSSFDFVTAMKTGKKQLVNENFPKDQIHHLEQMEPGDHIIIAPSKFNEHLLVVATVPRENVYVAYTTNTSGQVKKVERSWKKNAHVFRVSYPTGVDTTFTPIQNNAEKQILALSSDEFVTMMKTGKPNSLSQQCLFTPNNGVCSYTPVTPHTAVDEGDHIIIRDGSSGKYRSIFIYRHISDLTFIVMPNLNDHDSLYGQVDLAQYTKSYRINYRESLPVVQALIRACSPQGEELLRKHIHNPHVFISWAIIGKQVHLNPVQLLAEENYFQRSTHYTKISLHEIELGDHLIENKGLYWFHFMVTGRTKDPTRMRIIYCFHTSIEEEVETLNPDKLYKIQYTECLPADIAIKRAQSQRGTHNYSPWARMKFVRWAKTGSCEGIEVAFLARKSYPATKSTIWSFTQLNPGDYLVRDEGRVARVHHFIVTEVHSPTKCSAIESWNTPGWFGKVRKATVILEEKYSFYRINYDNDACIASYEAIKAAQSFTGNLALPHSKITRERFVNYVKTGDAEKIDISHLSDDRFFLQRIAVQSALELKPGDHVESEMLKSERAVDALAYTVASRVRDKKPYHHMMVVAAVNERRCTVIHFSEIPWEKQNEVNEDEIDLFLEGRNVFRIHYPERINPEYSITILNGIRNNPNSKEYSVWKNNCEHLIMKATTSHAMSAQVNDGIHKALQQGKHVLKPLENALDQPVNKGAAREAMTLALRRTPTPSRTSGAGKAGTSIASKSAFRLGYRAAVSGAMIGIVGGIAVGVNLMIETPCLAHGLYKLCRQKKFGRITDNVYKNKAISEVIKSANTFVGGVVGTVGGQVAIPVPILGAAVGATVGSMVGEICGYLEGKYISKKLAPIKNVTLPMVRTYKSTEWPNEDALQFNKKVDKMRSSRLKQLQHVQTENKQLNLQHQAESQQLRSRAANATITQLQKQQASSQAPRATQQTYHTEFWVVPRGDVTLNMQRILGTGAWGFVVEGKFRGQTVAVKCLYDLIRDPAFIAVIKREISIMAQVRHPNLVLLIAAVIDEEDPLIIMELLDLSLRRAYERNLLDPGEHCKLSIFRDIASALNYLHLHHQGPIIHRDVSSANILLQSRARGQWRTKLSDFGSAKLVREATTTGPGAAVYSAPEVRRDTGIRQSSKVDVYSYGVVLCEVGVGQFPLEGRLPAMMQSLSQCWPLLHCLVSSCIQEHPDDRPTMAAILVDLDRALGTDMDR